ncbi:MAG: MacB family efflux pump subunit [Burkholderiaceae bacterium]|jgi:macrolide transport system ATP-binding/permease protein|nr:MacB family efflux pump subunit [Burkholderiaceae bacterium]
MASPLIALEGVWREFASGEQTVAALRDVSLAIGAGEMVAIVGASGSGKSTLMNLLGCLDRPSRGDYRFSGRPVRELDHEELARLRREHFGFIFQRYQLLPDLTARANVEVPALYAGMLAPQRRLRAEALLDQIGLAARGRHRPGQLSGGQQQRVSIARALMNGGEVILADEPTGALDSKSGEEVMDILRALHRAGHTIILVTHDMKVAGHADRIIELADGRIVADRQITARAPDNAPPRIATVAFTGARRTRWSPRAQRERLEEALRMALRVMAVHPLRAFLTMLGIMIGIASVVLMVGVGEGARHKVLAGVSQLGTHTIELWAGGGWGDPDAERKRGLEVGDAEALAREHYLAGASPVIQTSVQARHGAIAATASVTGVNERYPDILGLRLAAGTWFDADALAHRAQDVVIDPAARRTLFPHSDPIGQIIMLGGVPARVVGVVAPSASLNRWPGGQNVSIFAPHTMVSDRLTGKTRLDSIIVRVANHAPPAAAEHAMMRLLALRRGNSEVFVQNADGVRKTLEATSSTMTLLITSIAVIALIVGGIGVMNIMLVSVTERTREIGVRMAIGARRGDILRQFLVEAVLVCLVGGLTGIALAWATGAVLPWLAPTIKVIHSPNAIAATFVFACLTGILFGYLPARNAARLDPVAALSSE